MKIIIACVVAIMFIRVPIAWSAPTLNVSGTTLLGADNVDVGGNLFNVLFVDDSCAALYSGCDSASDFVFSSLVASNAASLALLDQVLLGVFDSEPFLTTGCESTDRCFIVTPYGAANPPEYQFTNVVNQSFFHNDFVTIGSSFSSTNTTGDTESVFAVWSPASVPAPGTALLLSTGLLGLAGYQWTQRRGERAHVG